MRYFIYVLKNIFNYQGRARRAEFGWFCLMNVLLQVAVFIGLLLVVGGTTFLMPQMESFGFLLAGMGMMSIIVYIGIYLYGIVSLLATLSLTARRLHDLGWSGWWQLAFYLAPLFISAGLFALLPIIEQSPFDPILIVNAVSSLIGFGGVVIMLILLFKDGQKHPNKYGESPKYPSQPVEDNAQALN